MDDLVDAPKQKKLKPANPPRFDTVVFDLDGTLVDTMPLVFRAYEYALAPYRAVPSRDEIAAVLGGPVQVGLDRLLPPGAPMEEAMERLWRYSLEKRDAVDLLEGARELLAQLSAASVRIGLWTGRDRESTELILTHFNLWDSFASVVCGDDLPTHKPDPQGLFYVLQQMGSELSQTAFVGDSVHDVRAGLRAGVFTVAVGPEAPYLSEAPDLVVRDLEALRRFFLAES